MKTAYREIKCGDLKKIILDVPLNMDFRHTISAISPKITEDYHISASENLRQGGVLFRITIGIRYRQFTVFIDSLAASQSKLSPQETMTLIIRHRVNDLIMENKKILYAELMQWANQANFGEVR